MNERIRKLTELTLKGEMYAHPTKTEYDREDLFLSRQQRESKQLCQFILNQQPVLTEYSKMTGFFNTDSSVVGDAFRRRGHAAFVKLKDDFYCKPVDNLSTFEWQHATADYQKVLDICNQVLEVAPNDSSATLRAWSTIGDIQQDIGDYGKAYKAYEKALKINPDYTYVLNNYAYHLSMEGKKLKKALAMSKKTIEAEPDNATYLDTFGWILYLQGKALEAKPFFKHAMLYGGKESPVIMDHYAEVLYALKEYDLASVYWNMAKQKNNGDIPDLDEKIEARRKAADR